jgi:hypothetical protein
MDRRTFKRIYVNLHARFFFDDTMYTGTISNLSGNGMYIKMDMGLYYYKQRFNVQLLLINGSLDIPVMLSRFVEADGFYYSMGVELVDPPKQYLDFAASLGSSLNSAGKKYHP